MQKSKLLLLLLLHLPCPWLADRHTWLFFVAGRECSCVACSM